MQEEIKNERMFAKNLHELKILKTYIYYDQPVLYSCIDTKGQHYIAVLIDIKKDKEIWLYLPLSSERLNLIENNKINIKEAFMFSETGYVIEVEIYNNNEIKTRIVSSSKLNEEDLPESLY